MWAVARCATSCVSRARSNWGVPYVLFSTCEPQSRTYTPAGCCIAILSRRTLQCAQVTRCYSTSASQSTFVLENFYGFQRHQSISDHGVQLRKKVFNLFSTIHYLDHHRQILRQAKNLCRMQDAMFAESHHASKHGSSGHSLGSRF